MTEGAIFDMDGVLVDNVKCHVRAWQQLGRELGRELTEQEIRALFGQRNKEILAALLGEPISDEEAERLGDRKEVIYRNLISAEVEPVAGLPEFLTDLKNEGMKLAVATSGPRENVDLVLRLLRFEHFFDAVVTGEEVVRSKPAPDIFLLAAERLNLHAGRCVVFEDSLAGIEAAHQAGSPCIALATTYGPAVVEKSSASRVISDFSGLRAADVRRISGGAQRTTA